MATTTRTKKVPPAIVPAGADAAALAGRQEARGELADVAALLEAPEAFREWLQAQPGDAILVPGGRAPAELFQASLWRDPLEHPVTHWLRAIGSRGIWIDGGGDPVARYRLLCSCEWAESPAWLSRFEAALHAVETYQWVAHSGHGCPTPQRVLPLLDRALAEVKHAP